MCSKQTREKLTFVAQGSREARAAATGLGDRVTIVQGSIERRAERTLALTDAVRTMGLLRAGCTSTTMHEIHIAHIRNTARIN